MYALTDIRKREAEALAKRCKTPADRCKEAGLTPAEAATVALVAAGLTNGEIAKHRSTTERTVLNCNTSIYEKLGIFDGDRRVKVALWYWGVKP